MDAECTHCGLPLGRRPLEAVVAGVPGRFCCAGCVLALQVTRARGDDGAAAALAVRLGLAVFFALNVMMVSMPTYAPAVYGPSADGPLFGVLRAMALAFSAPVLVLLGGPILAGAWAGLRAGAPNADALIALGTAAAWMLSAANTWLGRPAVYFDTAAMLLVLVTLGRFLEARARATAGRVLASALAPAPPAANRVVPGGVETVAPARLAPGDRVLVRPGEAFPTDGVVEEGAGGVDEAALTGESRPVAKRPGAAVAGGTVSVDGVFRVRVTAPASASAAARVAALLAAARRERTAAERLADRVARALTPAVAAMAVAAGLAWGVAAGAEEGVLVGLAVLVVACPCALGIATPLAVWTGLAAAAARGVVVRSARALERAAAVDRVLFDKTGTLTARALAVTAVEPMPGVGRDALLARAAALARLSTHPVARAVAAAGPASAPAATDVETAPGRGVRGVVAGERCLLGSPRFAAEVLGAPLPASARDAAAVLVADGRVLGAFRVGETVAPGAGAAVAALRAAGVAVSVVTGDTNAAAVVPGLVPATDAAVGLLPEEKVAHVRAARAAGAVVAVVGDGINDAPALAASDLGIAVAGATDLARVTADVAVLGDLAAVPWLLAHARRVRRIMRQNLAWAFAYNAGAVALAAAGRLDPLIAALAMLGSSLAVVANARRLRCPGMAAPRGMQAWESVPERGPDPAPRPAHDALAGVA
jgi:Cu2+-exporting ATPase